MDNEIEQKGKNKMKTTCIHTETCTICAIIIYRKEPDRHLGFSGRC